MSVMTSAQAEGLKVFRRGKVRDTFELDDDTLLMVATDRLSAFDVVLPTPIPDKGRVLTQMSRWWFDKTKTISANHLLEDDPEELHPDSARADMTRMLRQLAGRLSGPPKAGSQMNFFERTGISNGTPMYS